MEKNYPVTVRPARPEEWPKVSQLYQRENDLPEVVEAETDGPANFAAIGVERLIWFAEADSLVVGLIQLLLEFPEKDLADGRTDGLIRHLKVAKDWEGQGIASLLHEAVVAEAKRRGFRRLTIECRKDNTHALNVYLHWGYKVIRDGRDSSDHILSLPLS